ncbi:MAG: hypothetical protein JXA33_25270, partial [Anaerolineae bacterium]|nr:hypothetical protein [Anaerolineae bacterium]
SLRNSLRNVATRAWMHNRWWVNDPDTLMVRDTETQLTQDEILSQVTLLGLSGNFYFISDDLDQLSPERRAIVNVLLPPLLEGMDVLDLFSSEMPEEVLVPVARPWGSWRLVGMFNWSSEPIERQLPKMLTLDRKKTYHIVDFWERRYLRLQPGTLSPTFHISSHGCVLLGIRSVKPAAQLVATTFHVSQGAEISEWQTTSNTVSLTIYIGRLAHGEVWLALPSRPIAASINDMSLDASAICAIFPGVWSIKCYVNHSGTLRVTW